MKFEDFIFDNINNEEKENLAKAYSKPFFTLARQVFTVLSENGVSGKTINLIMDNVSLWDGLLSKSKAQIMKIYSFAFGDEVKERALVSRLSAKF